MSHGYDPAHGGYTGSGSSKKSTAPKGGTGVREKKPGESRAREFAKRFIEENREAFKRLADS
jgi:hypothetical protein